MDMNLRGKMNHEMNLFVKATKLARQQIERTAKKMEQSLVGLPMKTAHTKLYVAARYNYRC